MHTYIHTLAIHSLWICWSVAPIHDIRVNSYSLIFEFCPDPGTHIGTVDIPDEDTEDDEDEIEVDPVMYTWPDDQTTMRSRYDL